MTLHVLGGARQGAFPYFKLARVGFQTGIFRYVLPFKIFALGVSVIIACDTDKDALLVRRFECLVYCKGVDQVWSRRLLHSGHRAYKKMPQHLERGQFKQLAFNKPSFHRPLLIAPTIIRLFRNLDLVHSVNTRLTLPYQHIYLAQLCKNRLRFSLRRHFRSSAH